MKLIITESQYHRLFENTVEFDKGDLKEYPGSTVSTSTTIHDKDNELELSKPVNSDEFASTMTTQGWDAHSRYTRR